MTARRLILVGACFASALAVFGVFRLADSLNLIPAGRESAGVLSVVAAVFAGVAVFVAPLVLGSQALSRRIRILLLAWLAASAILLTLYVTFVVEREIDDVRVGSRVAFWPPCIEGSLYTCEPGEPREVCLNRLAYRDYRIENCWGEGRILSVKLALAVCSLMVSGGFGGLTGLVLARRTDVAARPLRLFICYRRADTGAAVEVLAKRLSDEFGAGNVFRDVEDIRLGTDFRQTVRQALSGCDVFLLMIGAGWLDARDAEGSRRLDRADDPVRIEIETAIARGLSIVPVLVGGARMPRRDQMPDGLEELSNRAGAALLGDPAASEDPAFSSSVDALVRQLGQGRPDGS